MESDSSFYESFFKIKDLKVLDIQYILLDFYLKGKLLPKISKTTNLELETYKLLLQSDVLNPFEKMYYLHRFRIFENHKKEFDNFQPYVNFRMLTKKQLEILYSKNLVPYDIYNKIIKNPKFSDKLFLIRKVTHVFNTYNQVKVKKTVLIRKSVTIVSDIDKISKKIIKRIKLIDEPITLKQIPTCKLIFNSDKIFGIGEEMVHYNSFENVWEPFLKIDLNNTEFFLSTKRTIVSFQPNWGKELIFKIIQLKTKRILTKTLTMKFDFYPLTGFYEDDETICFVIAANSELMLVGKNMKCDRTEEIFRLPLKYDYIDYVYAGLHQTLGPFVAILLEKKLTLYGTENLIIGPILIKDKIKAFRFYDDKIFILFENELVCYTNPFVNLEKISLIVDKNFELI